MLLTTLCYIEKEDQYLMLYRNKKKQDVNEGKWIGVGGKIEKGESPEECLVREIKEETGLIAEKYTFRGLVIFNFNEDAPVYMYLYTCTAFRGEVKECNEGDLKWVDKKDLFTLNLWEGDKIFLKLLEEESRFFYLDLVYQEDILLSHTLYFENPHVCFELFLLEEDIPKVLENIDQFFSLCEEKKQNYYILDSKEYHSDLEDKKESYKIIKFRVKKEWKELVYHLIQNTKTKEKIIINIYETEV